MNSAKTGTNRTKQVVVSGNGHLADTAKARRPDRRVARTKDVLGDALVELMHEKEFETITVQQLLDRAGVSRSTFYSHYSDKDDLFFSDAEEFFQAMATALSRFGDKSKRVAPVQEFFEHVADFHKFRAALVSASKFQDVMELGQGHFARGIAQRLGEIRGARPMNTAKRNALGHAFAGAMFSLLHWWLANGKGTAAAQMDETFHQMVWATVGIAVPAVQGRTAQKKVVLRRALENQRNGHKPISVGGVGRSSE